MGKGGGHALERGDFSRARRGSRRLVAGDLRQDAFWTKRLRGITWDRRTAFRAVVCRSSCSHNRLVPEAGGIRGYKEYRNHAMTREFAKRRSRRNVSRTIFRKAWLMSTYAYTAFGSKGKLLRGNIEEKTWTRALRRVKEMGLFLA